MTKKGVFLYVAKIPDLLKREYSKRQAQSNEPQSPSIWQDIVRTHSLIVSFYEDQMSHLWEGLVEGWVKLELG